MGRGALPHEALRRLALSALASRLARLGILALLAGGCASEAEPTGDPDQLSAVAGDHATGPGPPVTEAPLVEGTTVVAHGVRVPVPDGWEPTDAGTGDDLVVLTPRTDPDELPRQFIMAGALDASPLGDVTGGGFEEVLGAVRGLHPDGPLDEQEVEVDGAARARTLRFDGLNAQSGGLPASDLVVLASDGAGEVWMFTYTAPVGEFDVAIADALVAGAGLDPPER